MNNGVTVVRNIKIVRMPFVDKGDKERVSYVETELKEEWEREEREEEKGKKIIDVLNVGIVGNIIFYWERERGSLRNMLETDTDR